MKKILLTFAAVTAFLCSAMAVEDATVDITLSSTNNRHNVVSLAQGAAYTNEKNATDMYVNLGNFGTAVNIYAKASYGDMSVMTTNDLQGVYLGITTNACTEDYTFTFTGVSGKQLYLYDHVENVVTAIAENGTYIFDAAATSTIENRFQILHSIAVTTNEEGYATFACGYDVVPQTPAALTVYAGAINGEELTLSAVNYVKAGEGVVVKGAATTTYNFLLGSGTSDFSANDLIGCPTATTAAAGTNFVLSYQNSQTAFYQYTGTTIPAGKAYLNFPAASAAPKRIRMVVGGTQGVENVEAAVKSEKVIRDGQIVIIRNGVEYNAAGQIIK